MKLFRIQELTTKLITLMCVLAFILAFSISKAYSQADDNTQADPEAPFFFYSETCSACHSALAKIEEYGINDEITVNYLDIAEDVNYNFFYEKGKECNMVDSLGTPMLYHNGECHLGATKTVGYLLQLANIDSFSETQDLGTNTDAPLVEKDQQNENDLETYNSTNQEIEDTNTENSNADTSDIKAEMPDPWRPNLLEILAIVGAPIAFFLLSYLMVTKLKL